MAVLCLLVSKLGRGRLVGVSMGVLAVRVGFVGVGFRGVFRVGMLSFGRRAFGRDYVDLGGCQTTPHHLAHLKPRANIQRNRGLSQGVKGNARIHQGTEQHIAAYAGKTLQISNSHRSVILNCRLCAAPR